MQLPPPRARRTAYLQLFFRLPACHCLFSLVSIQKYNQIHAGPSIKALMVKRINVTPREMCRAWFDRRDLSSLPSCITARSQWPSIPQTHMHISGSRSSMQRPPAVQPVYSIQHSLQYIFWKKHHGQVLPTSFFRSQKIERPNPRITEAMHLVCYTKARNMEACSKLLYIYAVANRHRNSTHSHRNTSHHLKQVKRKYLPRPDQHQFQDWW